MNTLKFPIIHANSENSILLTWSEKVCAIQHQHIIAVEQLLKDRFGRFIFESIVSYNSLLIYYHFEKITFTQLVSHIKECDKRLLDNATKLTTTPKNLIEIPVYYGEDAGWDINYVAQQCQITKEQVIALHSQTTYRAYALGFTPGFCYLANVDTQLILPRKKTPRLQVPKGAVAIAEQQTAVYPNVSPGGWHIIGQTPIAMYSSENGLFIPTISVGQEVKFTPIDKDTFQNLNGKVHKR